MNLTKGILCDHPGCLSHISQPCEGCGRIAGQFPDIELTNISLIDWKELVRRFRELNPKLTVVNTPLITP